LGKNLSFLCGPTLLFVSLKANGLVAKLLFITLNY
jgi:hypothetical protein